MTAACRRKGERGSVLILSLWIMLFLSLFAWGMARRASLEALITRHVLEDAALESLARDKALDAARAVKEKDVGGPTSFRSPWWAEFSEEESRVNVNKADLPTLTRLFGGDADLAAAVLDWRDADDKTTPGGAESGHYRTRTSTLPRNGPFQFPEELLLVKGMTREAYDKARPLFTLWGDGRVNWNTAPAPVLEALGFSKEDADRLHLFRLGPDALPGTEDDRVASQILDLVPLAGQEAFLTDEGKAVLSDLLARNRFSFRGTHLRWAGILRTDESARSRPMTLVLAPWDKPGDVVLWREK